MGLVTVTLRRAGLGGGAGWVGGGGGGGLCGWCKEGVGGIVVVFEEKGKGREEGPRMEDETGGVGGVEGGRGVGDWGGGLEHREGGVRSDFPVLEG